LQFSGGKTERYQQNLRKIVRRREEEAREQALKKILRLAIRQNKRIKAVERSEFLSLLVIQDTSGQSLVNKRQLSGHSRLFSGQAFIKRQPSRHSRLFSGQTVINQTNLWIFKTLLMSIFCKLDNFLDIQDTSQIRIL
jgi:hypothetical protein